MTAGENPIVAGSSSVSGERWGDYNDMGIDPVDGCTFWFVGNYSSGGARTNRVASFKFDECGGPSFTLTSPAPSVAVCANSASPTNAVPITLNAASVNGFVGAVALTYPNPFGAGLAGSFTPSTIPTLPGSSVAQLTATNAAAPGTSNIIARGTSGAIVRNVQLSLTVATGNPAAPTLVAPADNASGIGATPTFSWAAAAQAASYLVEASTSAGFGSTLFSQTVTGTSLVSPVALPTNQQIFWRVTANNVCGGTASVVYSYNGPTFTMTTPTSSVSVCANSASPVSAPAITLNLAPVNGFVGSVAMSYPDPFPTGIAGTLTPNPVPSVPGSTTAQLTATSAATPGAATIVARGVSGLTTRDVSLTLNVSTATPGAPTLTAPANAATNVTIVPTFNWSAAAQATSYVVEASTSNTFGTTLFSQTVTGTSLVSPVAMPPNTQIFWRVRPANICGNGSDSAVFSFTTANVQEFCRNGLSVAIPDNNLTGVSDSLTIAGVSGNVGDLDVRVELTHTYIGDLQLRLARGTPAATVNLMTNPTNNPSGACSGDNLNALFDDDVIPARPAQSACASGVVPTYSGTVTPQQATGAFDGQSPNSTWTLTVIDSASIDVGTLTRWCIILN
jgi:subtilisin-like proprotein convertase family protein